MKNARHQSRQIVLISDLQSNGWSAQFENWDIDQSIDFIPVKIAQEDMATSSTNGWVTPPPRNMEFS